MLGPSLRMRKKLEYPPPPWGPPHHLPTHQSTINIFRTQYKMHTGSENLSVRPWREIRQRVNSPTHTPTCIPIDPPTYRPINPHQTYPLAHQPVVRLSVCHSFVASNFSYFPRHRHVTDICKNASRQLAVLKRLGRFLTEQVKMVIYNSFISSNFSYCPLACYQAPRL